MMHLAIRGYVDGDVIFDDRIDVDCREVDSTISDLAKKHMDALAAQELHMIEIEFLDEPNPLQRFFRFGSDLRLMHQPVGVNLSGKADA